MRRYTSSEARQRLPGILQDVYGSKAVVGVERYGKPLAAIVPPEAVWLLAGYAIDPGTHQRIAAFARELVTAPSEGVAVTQTLPREGEADRTNSKNESTEPG